MEIDKNVLKRIVILTAVVFIPLLYFFADARIHAFPKCPFYSMVHLYCPGCGSQRALSALLHGDILEAMHDNVLMMLFLPFFMYDAFIQLRYTGMKMRLWYDPLFVKIVLGMVLSFWVLRNIPLFPFSFLAPVN